VRLTSFCCGPSSPVGDVRRDLIISRSKGLRDGSETNQSPRNAPCTRAADKPGQGSFRGVVWIQPRPSDRDRPAWPVVANWLRLAQRRRASRGAAYRAPDSQRPGVRRSAVRRSRRSLVEARRPPASGRCSRPRHSSRRGSRARPSSSLLRDLNSAVLAQSSTATASIPRAARRFAQWWQGPCLAAASPSWLRVMHGRLTLASFVAA
jgi:hypothetical protein